MCIRDSLQRAAATAAESAAEGNDHLRRRFLVRSSDAETEEAARGERRIGEIGQKKSRPGGRLFEQYIQVLSGAMGRRTSRARSACQLKG